jgi:hypothetical protein
MLKEILTMDAADSSSKMEGWHLDKKVPIALIVTLLMQTGTIVWWARGVEARVQALETMEIRNERKFEIVASDRDRTVRLEEQMRSVVELLRKIEAKIDRIQP